MRINELVEQAHKGAKKNGFWGKSPEVGTSLMLIVSELGEAIEAHRNDKITHKGMFDELNLKMGQNSAFESIFRSAVKDTFEDELADAVIRIADLCGAMNIDLQKHIELKLKYNETRPYKHGKKY